MPMPPEYRHATRDYDAFIEDLRDRLGAHSRNVAYTTAQAVLIVFRRRLTVAEGLTFADALPTVLRAIFVAGWDPDAAPEPFADRDTLTAEVLAVRQAHNFAPPSAIADVAGALRAHVDQAAFDRALAKLPPDARAYWAPPAPSPRRSD